MSASASGERKLVTVLFADVTGSTELADRLDPEELREVMAAWFATVREEVDAQGGQVEKYVGDAVMAVFGVPAAHQDDPARALRAALAVRARLAELNVELARTYDLALEIRIGINTGDAVTTRDPVPGEAFVTGVAVNVAARLEQLAEPGQTVVAKRTARAAPGFRFEELGALELRGKEQSVPAVLLMEAIPNAPTRGLPGMHAPLVGRDRENVGEAETEAFWRSFLRSLVDRGLTGVQLVVSDAHAGLKKAIGQVLGCPWQRCSVHFLREALGHARREQQPMLAALIRPIFNAAEGEQARAQVTAALERLEQPLPKLHELLSEAEDDLLAFYAFPSDHWPKLRSTNPLERVNREIGRRTDVVGIFPNDRSLIRLAASVVIEQNDEWLVGKRYLSQHTLETILTRQEDKDRKETPELAAA